MRPLVRSRGREGRLLVVGVGSGSSRTMELVHTGSTGPVDTLFVTTDESDLQRARADVKFMIGRRLCGGKGAMGITELGERSAEDARRDLEPYMTGYPLMIIVSTLGKGTGSGAAPVLASIGEGLGAFVLNFAIIPSATLEPMPRTVANHSRNKMLKRGFNLVTIDQDRFMEMNGSQPFAQTMASLDALISWIVISLGNVVFGESRRCLTVSDLRSVFREGNEGTIFIGGSYTGDPKHAANEFVTCGLMKRDIRTGKGFMLNLVTPMGVKDAQTKPFIEAVMDEVDGRNKTVFVGSLEDPHRKEIVDLIGIITGMEDGSVRLSDITQRAKADKGQVPQTIHDRWDIPMIR